jgi:Ser/Thr protein kinase RdoA (MazF antagonist)
MIKLFQPNNHSISKIKYKEVGPQIYAELSKILSKEYDLNNIKSIAQVQETEINSNNFKVETQENIFLLRKSNPDREEKLKRVYNISEHCRKKGVPTPKIIPSKKGLIVKEKQIYTLFEFIPGNHFKGSSLKEIEELGRGIAKIHKALISYDGEVLPEPPRDIRSEQPYSSEGFFKIKEIASGKKDNIRDIILNESKYLIERAEKVKQTIARSNVRKQPIHLDLHLHNTIFKNKKLKAIIDFETCCISELVRDVAYSLHRAIRQYVIKQNPSDIKKTVNKGKKSFLDAYEEINKLTEKEKKLIPLFIQDEGLHRAWLVASNYYLKGNLDWIKDLEKQIACIKEGEYFEDD